MVKQSQLLLAASFVLSLCCATAEGANRVMLKEIAKFVSHQPSSVSGCGLLLDLAAVDSSESLTTAEKLQLIGGARSPDEASRQAIQDNDKYAPFFRVVRVESRLEGKSWTVGEEIDCEVASPSARSISEGYLLPTELRSNGNPDGIVYGVAHGFVETDDKPSIGSLMSGCKLHVSLSRSIVRSGRATLKISDKHAGIISAEIIAERVREMVSDMQFFRDGNREEEYSEIVSNVTILDERHISIRIPDVFEDDAFSFAAQILEISHYLPGDPPLAAKTEAPR